YAANQEVIWLGFFFLAVLPSTVSSSVVMVSMARGNVPAAIFNASISGFIGMLVTPAWMSPFASTVGMKSEMSTIYLNLFLEVLLPVILGLFLNPWGGTWARKQAKKLAVMDKATILLIVYKSFAASFLLGIFSSVSWQVMSILCVIVFLFFFLVYGLLTFLARKLQFTLEESIVVVFCGSKKSLVHGTVFSKILFAASPQLGIILLPLMIYHALQLVFISQIAGKLARRK
ncbi:MAG: bile acid:sodium symporter, partial [Spirosomataceae bacterium]